MKLNRKKFIWFLILIFLGFPANLDADQKDTSDEDVAEEKANYLLDSLLLTTGIITQYPLIHELGHWIGGGIVGENIEFSISEFGGWNTKKEISNENKNIVSSSGFIFPVIISEAILDTPAPKDNPYVMGLVLGPLIHNASYIIQDSTGVRSRNYNDFETMDKAGIGREITYPIALILPAIQVWRLTRNKEAKSRWNLWMGVSESRSGINISFKF